MTSLIFFRTRKHQRGDINQPINLINLLPTNVVEATTKKRDCPFIAHTKNRIKCFLLRCWNKINNSPCLHVVTLRLPSPTLRQQHSMWWEPSTVSFIRHRSRFSGSRVTREENRQAEKHSRCIRRPNNQSFDEHTKLGNISSSSQLRSTRALVCRSTTRFPLSLISRIMGPMDVLASLRRMILDIFSLGIFPC